MDTNLANYLENGHWQGRRSILNIGGDDWVARQRQLRACAHRGVSEGGCAPLRSWKIFEF